MFLLVTIVNALPSGYNYTLYDDTTADNIAARWTNGVGAYETWDYNAGNFYNNKDDDGTNDHLERLTNNTYISGVRFNLNKTVAFNALRVSVGESGKEGDNAYLDDCITVEWGAGANPTIQINNATATYTIKTCTAISNNPTNQQYDFYYDYEFNNVTLVQDSTTVCTIHLNNSRNIQTNVNTTNWTYAFNARNGESTVRNISDIRNNYDSPGKVIRQTYNTTTTEDVNFERIFAQFKYYNITANSNATLSYNNTIYNATIVHDSTENVEFYANVTPPIVYWNNTYKTFNWSFELEYSNGTILTTSTEPENQSIYWNLTKYPRCNITARDVINDKMITSFRLNDSSLNYYSQNSTIPFRSSVAGSVAITFFNNTYSNETDDIAFTAGELTSYQYDIYTHSSYNFTFRDEDNDTIINWLNISVDFIGDTMFYNYSTTTGNLYVDLLYPETYTIRYYANDTYQMNHYKVHLINTTHTTIVLYMTNSTDQITTTIYDQVTLETLEGATVYLKKFFDNEGVFKTVSMYDSDAAGKSYFYVEQGTEFYKFQVDYPFRTNRLNTEKFYINSDAINLYINLQGIVGQPFFEAESITYSLSSSESARTFTTTWSDSSSVASKFCFSVVEYGDYGTQVHNSSCTSTSSGSITLKTPDENATYYSHFTANIDGETRTIATGWIEFSGDKLNAGAFGLFMSAIIIIVFVLMAYLHIIALMFANLGLILAKLLGILPMSWEFVISVFIGSMILAIIISTKK